MFSFKTYYKVKVQRKEFLFRFLLLQVCVLLLVSFSISCTALEKQSTSSSQTKIFSENTIPDFSDIEVYQEEDDDHSDDYLTPLFYSSLKRYVSDIKISLLYNTEIRGRNRSLYILYHSWKSDLS